MENKCNTMRSEFAAQSTPSTRKKAWLEAEWLEQNISPKTCSVWLSRLPLLMASAATSTPPPVPKQKPGRAGALVPQVSKPEPAEEKSWFQASCLAPGSTRIGAGVLWALGRILSNARGHPESHQPTRLCRCSTGLPGRLVPKRSHASTTGAMGCFAHVAETPPSTSCHSRKPTGLELHSDLGDLGHQAL